MLTTTGFGVGGRGTVVDDDVRPMVVPEVPPFPLGLGPFPEGRGVDPEEGVEVVGVLVERPELVDEEGAGRGPLDDEDGVAGRGPLVDEEGAGPLLRTMVLLPPLLVLLPELVLVLLPEFPLLVLLPEFVFVFWLLELVLELVLLPWLLVLVFPLVFCPLVLVFCPLVFEP